MAMPIGVPKRVIEVVPVPEMDPIPNTPPPVREPMPEPVPA